MNLIGHPKEIHFAIHVLGPNPLKKDFGTKSTKTDQQLDQNLVRVGFGQQEKMVIDGFMGKCNVVINVIKHIEYRGNFIMDQYHQECGPSINVIIRLVLILLICFLVLIKII
jgi:hypothetical protein